MKKTLSAFLLLIMMIFVSAEVVYADDLSPYVVCSVGGEYSLSREGKEILESGDLVKLLDLAKGERVFFDNVRLYTSLEIPVGEFSFSGNVFCENEAEIILSDGVSVRMENFSAEFIGSGNVWINGGRLSVKDSVISAAGEPAIQVSERGDSSLEIVGDSQITGNIYDIISEIRISFCDTDSNTYSSNEEIKLCYTKNLEKITDAFFYKRDRFPNVKIYDNSGDERQIFTINYVNERDKSFSEKRLDGEPLGSVEGEDIEGFIFSGWTSDGEYISDTASVSQDMTLYADYKLLPLKATVEPISFLYDGKERKLSVKSLYHPLLSEGKVRYKWYSDGKLVSENDFCPIKSVEDSGEYSLVAEFEYKGEISSLTVENISVAVRPIPLTLEYKDGEFVVVSGEIIEGDNVEIYEREKEETVYAETSNLNYCLVFSPENINSKTATLSVLLWTSLFLCLILFVAFFVFRYDEKQRRVLLVGKKTCEPYFEDPFVMSREESDELREVFFGVDSSRANELLTDRLARGLILRGGSVMTEGNGSFGVSIGEINRIYSSGETVDINSLKKNGIVPGDKSFVRITSDGLIDKPLRILANGFDITAVKMIVLAGGEAVKVKSCKNS